MKITEVDLTLSSNVEEKIKAYCNVVFDDCFVIHNVKILKHESGFRIEMPSRLKKGRCENCGSNNQLTSVFCNRCGEKFRCTTDHLGKFHQDVVHPICKDFRKNLEFHVLKEYHRIVTNGTSKSPAAQKAS